MQISYLPLIPPLAGVQIGFQVTFGLNISIIQGVVIYKMRIFAIDPGLTIGYAWYDPETEEFEAGQSPSHLHVIEWLEAQAGWDGGTFIVENYQSAGSLTKEAMITIKLVGYFEFYLDRMWGEVTLAPPQRRLSGVTQAERLLGGEAMSTMHRNGRDAVAALAHAIVAARNL